MTFASQDREALEYVRALVKKSGSSFALGMRILPRRQRYAMFAIYAFGREVDDIADQEASLSDKTQALEAWRHEIDRLFARRPTRLTSRALLVAMDDFPLHKEEFLALIEGMEMDIRGEMVTPSQETLNLYCRRVAGAVGILSLSVFGLDDPIGRRFALRLGQGFQLTNILRDLDEDAQQGRLYTPYELLVKYGLEPKNLSIDEILQAPEIEEVCRALASQAQECYREVRGLGIDRRKGRGSFLMLGMYETLLARLEKRGWLFPRQPIRLSGIEKMWAAFKRGFLKNR